MSSVSAASLQERSDHLVSVIESIRDSAVHHTVDPKNDHRPAIDGIIAAFESELKYVHTELERVLGNGETGMPQQGQSSSVQYGHPLGQIPVEPPHNDPEFIYTPEELSKEPAPPFSTMEPSPSMDPEPGFAHPQAATYTVVEDNHYRRGYIARASFDTSTKHSVKSRQLRMVVPPGASKASFIGGYYQSNPIPGCIRAIPGLPMVRTLDANLNHKVGVAGVQTLQSMRAYLGSDFPEFWERFSRLACNTFGRDASAGVTAIEPFYALEGLKRNDRSSKDFIQGSYDGSYNLGSTVGKGQGRGSVQPAVQAMTTQGADQIAQILDDVTYIAERVHDSLASKFEKKVTDSHWRDNNIFGLAGRTAATMLQGNVSSSVEELLEAIGIAQGSPHFDVGDDYTRPSLGVVLFRLPKGSNHGAFLLARHGVYIHECDAWMIAIRFSGNDLHVGFAPQEVQGQANLDEMLMPGCTMADGTTSAPELLKATWRMVGSQNRVFYVLYSSLVATQRLTSYSIAPPLQFGNDGAVNPHKTQQRNYSEHGAWLMGTAYDRANQLGREHLMALANALQKSNLEIIGTFGDLFKHIGYRNSENILVPLEPPPHDAVKDADHLTKWRSWYSWYIELCRRFYVRCTKAERASTLAALQSISPSSISSYIPTSFVENRTQLIRSLEQSADRPTHILKEILSSKRRGRKTIYEVLVEDANDPIEVGEDETWISHPINKSMFYLFTISKAMSQPKLHKKLGVIMPLHPMPSFPVGQNLPMQIKDSAHITSTAVPPSAIMAQQSHQSVAPRLLEDASPIIISANAPHNVNTTPIGNVTDLRSCNPSPKSRRTPRNGTNSSVEVAKPVREQNLAPSLRRSSRTRQPAKSAVANHSTATIDPQRETYEFRHDTSDERCSETETESEIDCELGEEFEVEKIVGKRRATNGTFEYQVTWTGYSDQSADWLSETRLAYAQELIAEYDLNEGMVMPKDSEDTAIMILPRSDTWAALHCLFNLQVMNTQLQNVQDLHQKLQDKRDYKLTGSSEIVHTLITHAEMNNEVEKITLHAPTDDKGHLIWDANLAGVAFNQLMQAVHNLPNLTKDLSKYDAIQRMIQLDNCRALVTVYEWVANKSPVLVEELMDFHANHGYDTLKGHYSRFADLVEHIVQFVFHTRRSQQANKPPPKTKRANNGTPDPPAGLSIPDSLLASLPPDMYGVRETGSKVRIQIPYTDGSTRNIGPTQEAVYKLAKSLLSKVWDFITVADGLSAIDTYFNNQSNSKRKNDDNAATEAIIDRCIVRGAVIKAIWSACGGDSVSVMHDMGHIIASPNLLFGVAKGRQKDSTLRKGLSETPEQTLAPLVNWLKNTVTDEHRAIFEQTGTLCHIRLRELHIGGPIVLEDFDSPLGGLEEPALSDASLTRRAVRVKNKPSRIPASASRVTPRPIDFGMPALILREALRNLLEPNEPPCNEHLQRTLLGRHTTQGRQMYDPDQTNPVRGNNGNIKTLKRLIPSVELATRHGISSLLMFMATGQGGKRTELFLNTLESFIFKTADACISAFADAHTSNSNIISLLGLQKQNGLDKLPGYKCFDNVNLYGSAANSLGVFATIVQRDRPNKVLTIPDKIKPFFTDSVQDEWVRFLGPMIGKDPLQYDGQKPSWQAGLQFVVDLDLWGFKNGLTLLQTAHNLSYLGITEAPDCDSLSRWMGSNEALGGYRGLIALGFHIPDFDCLQAAFRITYDHLDRHLSPRDKDLLCFGPAMVEHLLCKIARWDYRMISGGMRGESPLAQMAEHELKDATEWMQGRNTLDYMKFPIPPQGDGDERFTSVINEMYSDRKVLEKLQA